MGMSQTKEKIKEVLESAKKNLLNKLHKEYGNIPIVTLSDLTKEIVVVPSVRSGDETQRDSCDYYEVTPTQLDIYDELILEKEREFGPANKKLLLKYRLNYGDILVSYRGYRKILIGRLGIKESDKPIVAAVSNIRISFHEDDMLQGNSLSLLVHKYLTSDLAQSYFRARTHFLHKSMPRKRFTLSKSYLAEIPIPDFRSIIKENPLEPLYYRHKEKLALAKELSLTMDGLYHQIDDEDEAMIGTYIHKNEQLPDITVQEVTQLKQLQMLLKQAEMFLDKEKFEAYKQRISRLPSRG